jgi:DNA adenine methylase
LPIKVGGQRWDRPKTLFYLNPHYWGTGHDNGRGLFGRDDFERLSAALQRLQGRFILSLNDVPEVRELFAWASIDTVELSCQVGVAGHTKQVRGYDHRWIVCPADAASRAPTN